MNMMFNQKSLKRRGIVLIIFLSTLVFVLDFVFGYNFFVSNGMQENKASINDLNRSYIIENPNWNNNGTVKLSAASYHTHSWVWRHNSDTHWKECKTCGKCKQVETHTLYEYERVNATCYKDGYVRYKCTCGYKCRKILKSSNAHKYNSGRVTVSPTCCKKGEKIKTCTICGKTKKVALAPNDNHLYDDGVIIVSPTSYRAGTKRYTCKVCGKTKDVSITYTHTHTARYWDCDANGHWLNCDTCRAVYSYASHNFDSGVISYNSYGNKVITYTCKTCGYKKYDTLACSHTARYWDCDANGHWLNCDKCKAKYNYASHSFDSGVISYNSYGDKIITYTCKTCGYKKYDNVKKEESLGSVDILLGSSNYSHGEIITFTLKYSGVDRLKDLKIYLDDVEAGPSLVSLAYSGDHFVTYNIDTSLLRRGSIRLNIITSNCYAISTYINLQ